MTFNFLNDNSWNNRSLANSLPRNTNHFTFLCQLINKLRYYLECNVARIQLSGAGLQYHEINTAIIQIISNKSKIDSFSHLFTFQQTTQPQIYSVLEGDFWAPFLKQKRQSMDI